MSPQLVAPAALAAAGVVGLSGFAKLAEISGLAAAALVGIAAVLWRRPSAAGLGVVLGTAVLLTGLMANGYLYHSGEVPLLAFVLVLLSPVAGYLATLLPLPGKWRIITQTALMALPAIAALLLAHFSSEPAEW